MSATVASNFLGANFMSIGFFQLLRCLRIPSGISAPFALSSGKGAILCFVSDSKVIVATHAYYAAGVCRQSTVVDRTSARAHRWITTKGSLAR
eukprot:6174020-Pleurochrysis_carterae.AAC.2